MYICILSIQSIKKSEEKQNHIIYFLDIISGAELIAPPPTHPEFARGGGGSLLRAPPPCPPLYYLKQNV